jgi:hypothetical protein
LFHAPQQPARLMQLFGQIAVLPAGQGLRISAIDA